MVSPLEQVLASPSWGAVKKSAESISVSDFVGTISC